MSERRERWTSRPAFVMAAVGSAVGLGNVWRFPYICGKYGGGAFLIPYFVALLTAGIPLMILELGLGDMMQGSAPASFRKVKKGWEWLGWWALAIGSVIAFYYAVIMAWCVDYLWMSLQGFWAALPWGETYETATSTFDRLLQKAPKTDLSNFSRVPTAVLLGLGATWLSIFFCIHKGVKRVSRIVEITVPLPIILLVILIVRGVTLPGAGAGLDYFLRPNFEALKDPTVWLAAYGQVFFSLTLGFGVLIAYGSYLPKRSEIGNNAFIICLADAGIAFLAGLAVFSTIGYLAHSTGMPVETIAGKHGAGFGLIFQTFPIAISQMPFLQALFGVLFFLTLLTLGIDSAFSLVEGVVSGLHDKWNISRSQITGVFCGVGFIVGIIFTLPSGYYWLDICDAWMTNFGLVFVGLVECLVIGWCFNRKLFKESVNARSEIRIGVWWDVCIAVITPAVLAITIGLEFKTKLLEGYGEMPTWALIACGWAPALLCLLVGLYLTARKWKPDADLAPATAEEEAPDVG